MENKINFEQILFAVPSLNRHLRFLVGEAFNFLPLHIFVEDSVQFNNYNKMFPDFTVINMELKILKNIAHIRNQIIAYAKENNYKAIVMIDDDISGILKLNGKKLDKLNNEQVIQFILDAFNTAKIKDVKLWGIYPVKNHFFMKETTTDFGFITSALCGLILDSKQLYYDEQLRLKSDYGMALENYITYGGVLRYNNYTVDAQYAKNTGGCNDYRTSECEHEAVEHLKKKYPGFIRDNPKRENQILLKNMKLEAISTVKTKKMF